VSSLVQPNPPLSSGHRTTTPPAALAALVETAGVRFNGPAPWDIRVHDARLYARVLRQGSLGFGEAYLDGWWDCEALDELFHRLLACDIDRKLGGAARMRLLAEALRHGLVNLQSPRRAFTVGQRHYDIGNDVFFAMLDPTLSYSCAYWQDATTLAAAQQAKLELICRKLELAPGERLLEIGCGWGSLAHHAAKHHGARVFGITVSQEQLKVARQRCVGLPVTLEVMDYRSVTGSYDKVASVGMFEHVGQKNYAAYFDLVGRVMQPDGLFLLHTIGSDVTTRHTDPWIDRYIFPNGKLPSARELATVLEGRFVILDWHDFGPDYDRTLMSWWDNFAAAWPQLRGRYDERFYRTWRYYLMSCAGFFRSGQGRLWQLVLARRGRPGVYRSRR